MTSSNCCYSSLYPFPFDLNEDDQHQEEHHLFSLKSQQPSSSSSSCQRDSQLFQDQAKICVLEQDGALESSGDKGLKLSLWNKEERDDDDHHHHHEDSSDKWMPSKLRILRKMMSSSDHADLSKTKSSEDPKVQNQQQPSSSSVDNSSNSSYNSNNNNSPIRVCSDCNTTKTPLWRSGPRGPKSLCNACGIRQRKARRAMAAAAAATSNGTIIATETKTSTTKSKVQNKAKRSSSTTTNGCVPKLKKKKCKLISPQISQGRKKLNCFEDLRIILSKNSSFHGVFPQDEKEAAILLMALSYGLVQG